jgi:predicted metal-binding protein
MFPKPCAKCLPEFENLRSQSNNKYEAQRVRYCREFLRYQRENFSQRTEINALEVQLKHALEKLLRAERELIQAWKVTPPTVRSGDCLLTGVCAAEGHKIQKVQPKQKPVAWGMLQKDGLILDVISPEEHENYEGEYTIPLVTLQKAEPVYDTTKETPKCSHP